MIRRLTPSFLDEGSSRSHRGDELALEEQAKYEHRQRAQDRSRHQLNRDGCGKRH
jgi:hypothetical protein